MRPKSHSSSRCPSDARVHRTSRARQEPSAGRGVPSGYRPTRNNRSPLTRSPYQKSICVVNFTKGASRNPVGLGHVPPPTMKLSLWDSTLFALSALYRSTAICVRVRPSRRILPDAEIELIDSIAQVIARRDQVHAGELRVARQRPADRLLDDRDREVVVGPQLIPGKALERAAELCVDDRNGIGGEPLELREERGRGVAVGIEETRLGGRTSRRTGLLSERRLQPARRPRPWRGRAVDIRGPTTRRLAIPWPPRPTVPRYGLRTTVRPVRYRGGFGKQPLRGRQ